MKKTKSAGAKPGGDPMQKSERAYRTLVETSHDLIWSVDSQGRWTFVNAAVRRIYGYKPAEMLGRPFTDFQTPEQAKMDLKAFARIKAGTPYFNYETVHLRKDGSPVWLNFNAVVLRDDKGRVRGTTGTAQDITERKRAEAAARLQAEVFKAMADSLPVMLAFYDEAGRFEYANPAWERTLGWTLAEARKRDMQAEFHPDPKERGEVLKFMQATQGVFREFKVRVRNGQVREQVWATVRLPDGRGIGIGHDVTDRKQAEANLTQSEASLHAFLAALPEPAFLLDARGNFLLTNEALARGFGKTPRDLTGRPAYSFLPAPVAERRKVLVEEAMRSGRPCQFEDSNNDRHFINFLSPIADAAGRISRVAVIALDITERKRTEETLRLESAALEAAANAIFITNREGVIQYINPALTVISGYTAGEALGRKPSLFRSGQHDAEFYRNLWQTILGGRIWRGQITNRRKDGQTYISAQTIAPVKDARGAITHFVSVQEDITERQHAQLARDHSLSLWRATLESTADGILVVSTEGKIETYNRVFARMWRMPDELLATKDDNRALQFATDQLSDPQSFLEKVRYLYSHPQEESFDTLRFKDGRVFERYSRPQHIGGQVMGRVWSFRDVTEHKQAEQALRESEARLHAIVHHTPNVAVQGYDRGGHVRLWNEASTRMFGWNAEEAMGKTLDQLIHTREEAEAFRRILHDMAGTGKSVGPAEYHFHRRSGEEAWCLSTIFEIPGSSGEPLFICMDTDITERKRAEVALQESEEKFQALFAQSPLAIVLTTLPEGRVADANAAAELLLGRKLEEVRGKTTVELDVWVDPADRARYLQALQRDGAVISYEVRMRRKDGVVISVLYNGRLVRIGGQTYALNSMLDITEQKKMEEHLRQTQKMEAIGQLSGGVAHDLNNLLTVIKGHIGLLRAKGQVSTETVESVQQIDEAADRAANLTRQLLTFSRQQVMQPVVLNLNGVVFNLSKMLRRLLSETIVLEVECTEVPLPIRADEGMVEQVLLNLVVNARDALPQRGTLRITTAPVDLTEPAALSVGKGRPGAFACLAVRDTGTGIPPEVLPRIFEPFFTTKGIGKGTGLGLATVYGIMQQHDGWIEVESTVGVGTTFRVYFPRLVSAVSDSPAEQSDPPLRGGHEGILLVEDESAVRVVAETALSSLGYRVFSAPSGLAALQVWETHRHEVDLLLTDLVMPGGITGRDLAQRLRASAPSLSVIYMSGYSHDLAGSEFPLAEGANYLPKPFDLPSLANLVRASLDRGATKPPFPGRPA